MTEVGAGALGRGQDAGVVSRPVRVRNTLASGDRATQLLELGLERIGQALAVGLRVVDDEDLGLLELGVQVVGQRRPLDVVGGGHTNVVDRVAAAQELAVRALLGQAGGRVRRAALQQAGR